MRDTSDKLVRTLIITSGGIAFKSWSILQDSLRLFGLKPAISLMALGQTSLSTACFSAAECIKAGGLLGAARRSRIPVKGPLQTCFSGPLSPPWCCSAVTTLSLLARTQKCHVNMPTQELLDKQSYQATSSFIHLPWHLPPLSYLYFEDSCRWVTSHFSLFLSHWPLYDMWNNWEGVGTIPTARRKQQKN